jgi:hypothetical protein
MGALTRACPGYESTLISSTTFSRQTTISNIRRQSTHSFLPPVFPPPHALRPILSREGKRIQPMGVCGITRPCACRACTNGQCLHGGPARMPHEGPRLARTPLPLKSEDRFMRTGVHTDAVDMMSSQPRFRSHSIPVMVQGETFECEK